MKSLVIFGNDFLSNSGPSFRDRVVIDRVTYECDVIDLPDQKFDPSAPENLHRALIRVDAFSCNYRDKGIAHLMNGFPLHRCTPIGSEFAGEVIAVGSEVSSVSPGDRVIPNHHYTGGQTFAEYREGVCSNQSSREHIIIHEDKLCPIPSSMTSTIGAAFSIGAQTGYSMIRRIRPQTGQRILVTSARSNTSLFIIDALRHYGVEIYASTTSLDFIEAIEALGVDAVLPLPQKGDYFRTSPDVEDWLEAHGPFDAVLDPMYDVHLDRIVDFMAPFGQYVTCGMVRQNPGSSAESGIESDLNADAIFTTCISKNLSIHGNCIGLRSDLTRAIQDYENGRLNPIVDTVFSGNEAAGFLERTFNDRSRFGKVIFSYQ